MTTDSYIIVDEEYIAYKHIKQRGHVLTPADHTFHPFVGIWVDGG